MAGVALGVGLLTSIGFFIESSTSTMTRRAIANVPVDWQVETQPGADPVQMLASVRSTAGVQIALPVGFAATSGLRCTPSPFMYIMPTLNAPSADPSSAAFFHQDRANGKSFGPAAPSAHRAA